MTSALHRAHRPSEDRLPARATELLSMISAEYDVERRRVEIEGGHPVELFVVRDINVLLDRIDPNTFEEEERLPYWAELWPSAIGLARYLLRRPIPTGTKVLDLGCGLGLTGVVAAQAGAYVLACDREPDALRFARYNAELNGVHDRMTFRLLDWKVPDLRRKFRYILGSDILYEKEDHLYLERLLDRVLEAGGICLFSDPNRTVAREFIPRLLTRGYRHTQWSTDVTDGIPRTRYTVNVHRFVKDRRLNNCPTSVIASEAKQSRCWVQGITRWRRHFVPRNDRKCENCLIHGPK